MLPPAAGAQPRRILVAAVDADERPIDHREREFL